MTHLDLFSGIGGFALAAKWAGFETVAFCEINPFCQQVLKKNFGKDVVIYDDIKALHGGGMGTIDIITGGFPCQDISCANTKKGTIKGIQGARSGLWTEYARIIFETRPRWIIWENSPMLIQRGLERILSDLHGMGYDAEWRNFFASQFGLPHLRKRTYGLAYPVEFGCKNNNESSGILHKILPEQSPRQNSLSMPHERFHAGSNYGAVRMHDGFSKGLDRNRIHGCGNAIVPQIAYQIMSAIKEVEHDLP